jgi:SAM-dependent methyltransferase
MDIKKYTEANRVAWNEATPYHQKFNRDWLYESFAKPGFSCLDETISSKIIEIGIKDNDVAQLACNNGRELISLKNLGARRAVGFDISDAAIDEAKKLALHAGVDCEFVRTDVYEIPPQYRGCFDLIYVSIGALAWMPDLNRFFAIASSLLRNNGRLLIYEIHPFLHMFDPSKKDDPLQVSESYFRSEPWIDNDSLDYYGNAQYPASVQYNFPHKISDLINGCVKHRLEIALFEEYSRDISVSWSYLQNDRIKLPMSYILIGRKNRREPQRG